MTRLEAEGAHGFPYWRGWCLSADCNEVRWTTANTRNETVASGENDERISSAADQRSHGSCRDAQAQPAGATALQEFFEGYYESPLCCQAGGTFLAQSCRGRYGSTRADNGL